MLSQVARAGSESVAVRAVADLLALINLPAVADVHDQHADVGIFDHGDYALVADTIAP